MPGGSDNRWRRLRKEILRRTDTATCPVCGHPVDCTRPSGSPLSPVVDYEVPTVPGQLLPFRWDRVTISHHACAHRR